MIDLSESATTNALQTLASLREKSLPFSLLGYLTQDTQGAISDASQLTQFFDKNELARQYFALALAQWDQSEASETNRFTRQWSNVRREATYEDLGIPSEHFASLTATFPFINRGGAEAVILAKNWTPWYDERELKSNFYWKGYESVLAKNGWSAESVAKIDLSATQVVRRLSDPTNEKAYQAKGLVVGYVQSGKTAHFTAVTAKAIDAGYRLIVVLAGMHDILRSQTQRRLDMELVGTHNIIGGRDVNNLRQRRDIDYASSEDEGWLKGDFLTHSVDPSSEPEVPSIVRLSHYQKDFRALGAGIHALDFKPLNQDKPIFDRANLSRTDVKLVVIKKNKAKLEAFLEDLRAQKGDLAQVPALVIDDEADQASMNTVNQRNLAEDRENRTAINKLITDLLVEMPRAQYLAYTATPFANVFVNADDAADLFPKDFIFTLEAPPEYMGGQDFHDLDGLPEGEEKNYATSNEAAYVRDVRGSSQEDLELSLRDAIDAFVLSGALKLWRQDNCSSGVKFRHHTMLIHESVRIQEHELAKLRAEMIWSHHSHESFDGLERLRRLYETDFKPVSEARSNGYAFPEDFEALIDYVGQARMRIGDDGSPVRVVNGSKDSDYDPLVFDTKDFWKILVGGSKLSRGFTVEGLTVSYYRRSSKQEDTMMQMGRWFGYRRGYRDLIRLYIDREREVGSREYDLYEAFEAIVRDEMTFREEIALYSEVDENGSPVIEPVQVPPLVHLSAEWLRPTAANKMYNAQLVEKGLGGQASHLSTTALPEDDPNVHKHNLSLVLPWLRNNQMSSVTLEGSSGKFDAKICVMPAPELIDVLENFRWLDRKRTAEPKLGFLRQLVSKGEFQDFVLIVKDEPRHFVEINGVKIPITTFKRRQGSRNDFELPNPGRRHVLEVIAGKLVEGELPQPAGSVELDLQQEKRGAVLLSFGTEHGRPDDLSQLTDRDIAPIFTYATPFQRGQLPVAAYQFVSNSREAVVDKSLV